MPKLSDFANVQDYANAVYRYYRMTGRSARRAHTLTMDALCRNVRGFIGSGWDQASVAQDTYGD